MSDINEVIITGRLTRDSELKSTNSGTYLCRFDIASNKSVKDKSGEWKDVPGFYSCIAWAKMAEYISKYATKGRAVLIKGELSFSSWENAEGKKQSKVEIIVQKLKFIDGKKNESGSNVKDEFNGENVTNQKGYDPQEFPF